ncbi:MAG: terpene cyclase/mutase family protein [Thermoguttaceae bacterium]|nr:terpene cyclase/mutase family protein [Thermoguttaceae bacterium]
MDKIKKIPPTVLIRAGLSLNNMLGEMLKKNLELRRITKTASLLLLSGFSSPFFPQIANICKCSQRVDGGWVSIVDTMWNVFFLTQFNTNYYSEQISLGIEYINANQGEHGIWGRSIRDFERIPISGMMLYLLPQLITPKRMAALEDLWYSEKDSLTYKAAYTLLAFKCNHYVPTRKNLIEETVDWLVQNQRKDGSFAPWKNHPVASDTYCSSLALLGLLTYEEYVQKCVVSTAINWLVEKQLPQGIWPFHEIEDGTSWALYSLSIAHRKGF